MHNNFLIVDDDKEQRETVQSNIELELDRLRISDFKVISVFPFENPEAYFDFISQNNICVLILDEKLNNQSNAEGRTVDYLGHDLVSIIRKRFKDLPIYTITNYSEDNDVQNSFHEYEQVISRKDFYRYPEKYVPIMARAASKFVDRYTNILSELTKLSQEVAAGNVTQEKMDRIKALQASVELPLVGVSDRLGWLNAYEAELNELKSIREELLKRINEG